MNLNLISQAWKRSNHMEGVAIPSVIFPGRPCWIPNQENPQRQARTERYCSPSAALRRQVSKEMAWSGLFEKALFATVGTVSIFAVAFAYLGTQTFVSKYEIFLQTVRSLIG